MACFTVPVAEAVVATVVTKIVETKEKKNALKAEENMTSLKEEGHEKMQYDAKFFEAVDTANKIPFSRKLKWLDYMLWGGSALLAFEHIWHGELVPWFPFLTAAANSSDAFEMMHEIGTAGVVMAALVTLVWLGIVGVTTLIEKRTEKEIPASENN